MSPGHLASVREESSSSTGDGCHGDRHVSACRFPFGVFEAGEEELGTPKWTTGSDCWDSLASASDLQSAALSRPLLGSQGRARGQSDVARRRRPSKTVQARRGQLSNPAKPISPHFLSPPRPNQQRGTGQ